MLSLFSDNFQGTPVRRCNKRVYAAQWLHCAPSSDIRTRQTIQVLKAVRAFQAAPTAIRADGTDTTTQRLSGNSWAGLASGSQRVSYTTHHCVAEQPKRWAPAMALAATHHRGRTVLATFVNVLFSSKFTKLYLAWLWKAQISKHVKVLLLFQFYSFFKDKITITTSWVISNPFISLFRKDG